MNITAKAELTVYICISLLCCCFMLKGYMFFIWILLPLLDVSLTSLLMVAIQNRISFGKLLAI